MLAFTTPETVGKQLGGDYPVAAQDLTEIVAAANAYAARLPGLTNPDGTPTPSAVLGVTMLAARLYRRKNSPAGIEAITESGASYVARTDPDIARLLRIDQYATPRVG